MKKNILITGGAGFIGSNFIKYWTEKYPQYFLVNLDALTYAGDLDNLLGIESNPNYKFVKGCITDRTLLYGLFDTYEFTGVINFAAESHVDNSIKQPDIFINTNIKGTFVLIDVAMKKWMNKPFEYKEKYTHSIFHQISTDEVYGSLAKEGLFSEVSPVAPNSPYSASKASADMIVRSYHHTYGMNTITTNCSNNYGPNQHQEKLIPTIINCILNNKSIPIYGDGKNVRDWLYVEDHCSGIDLAFHKGKYGSTYNIGGRNEKNNLEIVTKICEILGRKLGRQNFTDLITFVEDRFGHDKRYAIDARKIEQELGWQAKETFESGIEKTIDHYLSLSNV